MPQAAWRALCEELGLDFLDLQPAFAASGRDRAELFSDLQHPNGAGLALAAGAVAEALGP